MQKYNKMFFTLSLENNLAIGAGATVRRTITIGSDADFLCKYISIPNAPAATYIKIEDSSGELWTGDRAVLVGVFGTGANYNRLPILINRVVPKNSTVTFSITAVGAINIDVTMVGFKLFPKSPSV